MRACLLFALAILWVGAPAWAQSSTPGAVAADEQPISAGKRSLGIAAALIPGVILHGSGSFAMGDRKTASRVALIQAISTSAILVGGLPLALTYGSPKLTNLAIPLIIGGAGLFMTTWLADIYAVSGLSRFAGRPVGAPPYRFSLIERSAYDPIFGQRWITEIGGEAWYGPVRVAPSLALASSGSYQYGAIAAELRVWGDRQQESPDSDSSLGVEVSFAATRYPDDGFSLYHGTAMAVAHLDLARLSQRLRGAFMELELGFGLEATNYFGSKVDVGQLPLGRFASGMHLGRADVRLFYDHRRDGLAGGLTLASGGQWGRPSSFLGSVGAEVGVRVHRNWIVRPTIEVGSAWVLSTGLEFLQW
jgi:hypothetical protein